jgi:mono/diheme cytochrome c family protein
MDGCSLRFLPAAALLLSACGLEIPGDIDARSAMDDPPAEGPFEPTIEAIQENVFDPSCVECHNNSRASGGLNLADAQTSYDNLVDVAAQQARDLMRVEPGNPDDSYLIHKLEGTQRSGQQMPLGDPALSQDTIDVIREWIDRGAEPPGEAEKETYGAD